MSEKEFKAKERTVQKMSRDGLLEESLSSGTSKRVSQRVRQDGSMKEGDISSDAGIFRHSRDVPGDKRKLYAEKSEEGASAPSSSQKGRQRQRPERRDRKSVV